MADIDTFREGLHPADAPNPMVWCERCQKMHRKYTFTQADYDAVIADAAAKLAESIDARVTIEVMDTLKGAD